MIMEEVTMLKSGKISECTLQKRWNAGTPEAPDWREMECTTIVEKEYNEPRYLVSTMRDITREVEEERENQVLWNRYMKLFDTNVVAMSFYDKNGCLLDMNQKMKDLIEFNEERERFFRDANLFNVPGFQDVSSLRRSWSTCLLCRHHP